MYTYPFLNALTIYVCAEGAVIEEKELVAIAHECAVSTGNAGKSVWECDVARGGLGSATNNQ